MRVSHVSRIGTPLLKNSGSTARDHLASERTFLAWMRTGLGFTALGIAVERFSQLDPSLNPVLPSTAVSPATTIAASLDDQTLHPHPHTRAADDITHQKEKEHLLVASLLGTGFGSIVYGVTRYFSNMRLLETGMFKPSYFGAAGLSVAVAALAGGAYAGALGERVKGRVREEEHKKKREEVYERRKGERGKW